MCTIGFEMARETFCTFISLEKYVGLYEEPSGRYDVESLVDCD